MEDMEWKIWAAAAIMLAAACIDFYKRRTKHYAALKLPTPPRR